MVRGRGDPGELEPVGTCGRPDKIACGHRQVAQNSRVEQPRGLLERVAGDAAVGQDVVVEPCQNVDERGAVEEAEVGLVLGQQRQRFEVGGDVEEAVSTSAPLTR